MQVTGPARAGPVQVSRCGDVVLVMELLPIYRCRFKERSKPAGWRNLKVLLNMTWRYQSVTRGECIYKNSLHQLDSSASGVITKRSLRKIWSKRIVIR